MSKLMVMSKSWADIVDFYTNFVSTNLVFQPMLGFVTQISNSIYATGLYPSTAMHSLLISQSEAFEIRHQMLRVDFNPFASKFIFEYFENSFAQPYYHRECIPQDAYLTFEHCLERLRWFLKSPEETK